MTDNDAKFSTDMLRGADAIAEFLFGDAEQRRKVYHLAATSNLPVFKLGSMICARKSVLLTWIKAQEDQHVWRSPKADAVNHPEDDTDGSDAR